MDKKEYWTTVIRNFFTLVILDIFIVIAVILPNLMPSIYDRVQDSYGLSSPAPIMVMDAFFIIIAAFFAVFWGYLIDKIDRKRILFQAIIVMIIGLIICTFAPNFPLFVIGRIITAIGFGAQMPASYSIISDIIPSRYWSTLFGSLALLTAICNAAGNFLTGFLAPLNIWGMDWKFAFALLTLLSIGCFFLLMLIKIPSRGASALEEINQDLGDKVRTGAVAYNFTIKKEDLKPLWNIDCNRWMLYLCFFAVIPGATMGTFLIYNFVNNSFASFPAALITQVSAIFAAMAGVGYMLGTLVLGPLFDWLHNKSPKARSRYTFWGLFFAIPLIIAAFMCIVPVDYNSLNLTTIDPNDPSFNIDKYVVIVTAIFETYPIYIAYFFLLLFGGFAAAPITINRTPTLLEINLPEHMGSSQAILNCSDQVGKGFTLFFLAFQLVIFQWLFNSVDGKILLILSVLFYIPPVLWWRKISRQIEADIAKKKILMEERAEMMEKSLE
jgi:MFS family permease